MQITEDIKVFSRFYRKYGGIFGWFFHTIGIHNGKHPIFLMGLSSGIGKDRESLTRDIRRFEQNIDSGKYPFRDWRKNAGSCLRGLKEALHRK